MKFLQKDHPYPSLFHLPFAHYFHYSPSVDCPHPPAAILCHPTLLILTFPTPTIYSIRPSLLACLPLPTSPSHPLYPLRRPYPSTPRGLLPLCIRPSSSPSLSHPKSAPTSALLTRSVSGIPRGSWRTYREGKRALGKSVLVTYVR